MNKQSVTIPKGIEYLGKWKDFNFNLFPPKCILDKVIPGCGFTQYCLTGSENVILCSPRKMLLENKKKKHKDSVYLVRNELEVVVTYDKNLSNRPDKSALMTVQNPDEEESKKIYSRIYEEINQYINRRFSQGHSSLKIMVTYDSFHIVKEILEYMGIFKNFFVVVDEFQTILHDAKFKSDTEIHFLDYLGTSHSSIFVSATPMMEEYLDELEEFNRLPYYVFDWTTEDSSRLRKPDLKVLTMDSVGTKCKDIIRRYKSSDFESVRRQNKETGAIEEVVSKEAVFYVNSVNHIINIINSCDLQPDEVNILCSDTDYNQKRLKNRLKVRGHTIGSVPGEDEPNKMFTFCTRTVYLGADFYSKCARSFVFGDANINTLVVDISEDLAQILGRQRDSDNPWRNSATFYYISSRKCNQIELEKHLKEKVAATESLLNAYNSAAPRDKEALSRTYEKSAKAFNYQDDYVAVNSNGLPVFNKLAKIAEKRAYEIQKYDYADRFAIFNKLESTFGEGSFDKDTEMLELRDKYFSQTVDKERLRVLCSISPDLMYKFINTYLSDTDSIKSIFLVLDQKKVRALGYNTSDINKEINNLMALNGLAPMIYVRLSEGDHYSSAHLAEILQDIYNKNGIYLKAKATDIKRWFETKDLKLQDKATGKRVRGIKLISALL